MEIQQVTYNEQPVFKVQTAEVDYLVPADSLGALADQINELAAQCEETGEILVPFKVVRVHPLLGVEGLDKDPNAVQMMYIDPRRVCAICPFEYHKTSTPDMAQMVKQIGLGSGHTLEDLKQAALTAADNDNKPTDE